MKSNCGCTDDVLCKDAKKLWKRKNLAGRRLYSYHRMSALGMLDDMGKPKYHGYTIRSNNAESLAMLEKNIQP